ncbi:MAG TPA: hypothetical protein VGM30_12950 [Puia sp.]
MILMICVSDDFAVTDDFAVSDDFDVSDNSDVMSERPEECQFARC